MAVIVVVLIGGLAAAFILSFAMGANDVANSFGTSVGSKVLTLRQAVLVAAVFETLGSVLVGFQVTDTVRKGIIDVGMYDSPERTLQLAFGALATLISSCLWLFIATFKKLPVSASHAIVGATLGFSLVLSGTNGVKWPVLGFIVASWFVSPVLSGLVSGVLYYFVDRTILSKRNATMAGIKALPLIYAGTIFINILAILWKGPQLLYLHELPNWAAALIALMLSILAAIVAKILLVPAKRRFIRHGSLRRLDTATANSSGVNDKAGKIQAGALKSSYVMEMEHQTSVPPTQTTEENPKLVLNQNKVNYIALQSIPSIIITTASTQTNNSVEKAEVQNAKSEMPPAINSITTTTIVENCPEQQNKTDKHNSAAENAVNQNSGAETAYYVSSSSSSTTSPTSSSGIIFVAKDGENSNIAKSSVGVEPQKFSSLSSAIKRPSLTTNELLPATGNDISPPSRPSTPVREDSAETKLLFSFVQILTACCASFAHGGNDVSNSVGPLVSIWLIYQTGSVGASLDTPLWILFFGGVGISLGLLVLGRKVIETVGRDLTHNMTPSSGFCIELGTVITVLFASKLGVPISTTHCIVGSVISVGYLRSRHSVDLRLFRSIAMSWVVTLPATVAFSALIMWGFQLTLPYFK